MQPVGDDVIGNTHVFDDEFYAQQLAQQLAGGQDDEDISQYHDHVWGNGPSGRLLQDAVSYSSPALSDLSLSKQTANISVLVLQSIKLIPSQHAGTPHFLSDICQCLPGLTSLTVAEPWVAGGQGRALTGRLTCLSQLTHLTSLTVALMPGKLQHIYERPGFTYTYGM
jgi:hypothetical protein